MSSNIICIAGAHRSGTSMLARLLHATGLALGPESDLMPAAADNPDGFWENLRFVGINDETLNAIGAAWDLPPGEDERFESHALPLIKAKAHLLINDFSLEPYWGWKDPRNCLTLPFWHSLIPGLKIVIIVRNPLEAAYSMHRRNGTSYALGLRLWEIYNRRLLTHTTPGKRIITDYQAFFDRPEAELDRVIKFIGISPRESATAAAIVTKDRRHTTFTKNQLLDAGVSQEIIALYDSFINEAIGSEAIPDKKTPPAAVISSERDRLAGVASELNLSIPESETVRRELAWRRGSEIDQQEKIERLQARIEELTHELSAHNVRAASEIGRRDGQITELQAAFADLNELLLGEQTGRDKLITEVEKNRHEAETLRQRLTGAEAEKQMVKAELERIRERFTQTNRLWQSQSIVLASREREAALLNERLRKQLGDTKRLVRFLKDATRAADLLRKSRRWILINPFAWIAALFSGRKLKGYGHLDRVVKAYEDWCVAHPEAENIDRAIQATKELLTQLPTSPVMLAPQPTQAKFAPSVVTPPPSKPIEFPIHQKVELSIIIPVFNQFHFTEACLASLQADQHEETFEVIVIDDGSTDATAEIERLIPGVTHLRNRSNLGFIASCNRGAEAARGTHLVFLNNDTTATPGWLLELRETFKRDPKAGLVGSKLVFPDGRLQEAGGIIWQDGTGWNRGKYQDPNDPEYNFLREVDYCSAAAVMIPKAIFKEVGGFDAAYAPGYYEDVDLAFKVHRAGYKVLYQPLSKVVHFEGATGGTDVSAGAKKYQEINRTKFTQRWTDRLTRRPVNGDLTAYEALELGQKHILVIDHHVPMPEKDAGSLRMFHIVVLLLELGHRVTFLPDNLADLQPYTADLQKRGVEVVYHPYAKSVKEHLAAHGSRYQAVVLSRCDFARKHVEAVRNLAPQSKIIFDTVDLHFLRQRRQAELSGDLNEIEESREKERQEYKLIDEADETWVVSRFERDLLRQARPQKSIQIVSTIVDIAGSSTPFSLRRDLLFIGSFQHGPNADAVLFFAKEIYPFVQNELPDAKFYIIGDKAPPEVIALASENIIVTGLQPDIRPFFDAVKLSVAPLRFGAGVKGKINQSMGFGVPVVATSLAVEGMPLIDGEDICVADTPDDFAQAVIALYQSEELWSQLSINGLAKTKEFYSTEAAAKQLALRFGRRHLDAPTFGSDATSTGTSQVALPETSNHRISVSNNA